jgi:hypothetical protein
VDVSLYRYGEMMVKAKRKSVPIPCGVHLTDVDVRALLETRRGQRSVEDQADEIGVSWQYLYKMRRSGDRPPNRKVLEYLKLDKVVMYQDGRK